MAYVTVVLSPCCRCVRADAVKQAAERGGKADMEMVLRKNKLFFWLMDPQTCNFVTSTSPHARPRAEMWQLKTGQEKKPFPPTQQTQKDKMHVTIKSGTVSMFADLVHILLNEPPPAAHIAGIEYGNAGYSGGLDCIVALTNQIT